ncbi:hypothetical protein GQX74_007951 [Glossina fuscipes]|nr:hypothetical protein GQX74_007951 [Glossina fuscipes]
MNLCRKRFATAVSAQHNKDKSSVYKNKKKCRTGENLPRKGETGRTTGILFLKLTNACGEALDIQDLTNH